MRKILIVTAIISTALLVFARTNYIGYSGAPGSYGTCASSCHGTLGGTVQISDFPAEYIPGQTYTVTISHSGGSSISQFNGSCRAGTGSANAGLIAAGTNTATYSTSCETNGIHFSSTNQNSGTFLWTAPPAGTGTVRLYIAGQQGSMSGPNSTLVYTSTELVSVGMRKAPYLIHTGTNTQMKVLWQLTATASCTIAWGTDLTYSLGSAQTQEYGTDHQHMYTISNLTPGSTYYFRVTANSQNYTGSFRTAPAQDATAIKFMAYGDTRTDPAIHNQVAESMVSTLTSDTSFQSMAIVMGNLVTDGNSESDWDNELFNPSYQNIHTLLANLPYHSAIGNYDGTGTLFTKYLPYPFVSNRYYSFDYGPAHFAVVDQYTDYSTGSAQLQWLENDLAATDKLWKFIYLHEPGWSAGNNPNNVNVQDYIQPLCEQYDVAILFAGHNHYYSRAIVNDVQHITTGGGGTLLDTPNPSYPNIVATGMFYHFCKVEIDSNLLRFTAINPEGTVIDTFTIAAGSSYVQGTTASPLEFSLSPAYPNPFNPTTTLSFTLPNAANVNLSIFDITGRHIATLIDGWRSGGSYHMTFDGANMASGIYLARLHVGSLTETRKIVLLK